MSANPDIIRVLAIEDNAADAVLTQEKVAEAQRVGWDLPRFVIEHVDRLGDALARLENEEFDVVLSDLDLPDSQADETVATLRDHIPQMPLVVLTGREDETLAHKSVRAGVQDYLYKQETTGSLLARAIMYAIERQSVQDTLERRVSARTAALQQANEALRQANGALEAEIAQRERVEEALQKSEERFKEIYAKSPIGIELFDANGELLDANAACMEIFGLTNVASVKGFKLFEDPNVPEETKQRLLRGETVQYETRFDFERVKRRELYETTRQGTIDLEVKITALGLEERSLSGYLVQIQEITARKRAEETVQRRATQLALLNDIGKQILARLTPDHVLDQAARLVQESFDYRHVGIFILDRERDEFVMGAKAGDFVALFPPDHRLELGQGMVGWVGRHGERLLANDVDIEPRYVNLYPDMVPTRAELSVPIWVKDEIIGVLDIQSTERGAFDESDVVAMETLAGQLGVAVKNAWLYEAAQAEIAERKRTQDALQKSEKKYRALTEKAPIGVTQTSLDGHWIYVNERFCEIVGYTRKALLELRYQDLTHPDDLTIDEERTQRTLAGETPGFTSEKRYIRKDGTTVWVHARISLIRKASGKPDYFIAVIQDVTTRKAAEEALRKSQQELRFQSTLLNQIRDNIVATDLAGRITYVNNAVTESLQKSREELIGQTVHVLGEDPNAGATQQSIIEKTVREGAWNGTVVNVAVDDTQRIMQARTWLIRAPQTNEPTGMVGVSTDITQRKEAEEALERIFTLANELICVADIHSATFTLVNPAFEETLGYTEEELLEHPFLDFVHPDDVAPTVAVLKEKLQAGVDVISFQNRYRCKDGAYRWLSWNSHPVPKKGLTYAIATDITKRKRRDQALRKSEARYRGLFENAPISLWEEDFSAVKAHIETLRERGIEDFEQYFTEKPEAIEECMHLIRFVNFNEATLDLYHAENKQALQQNLGKMLGSKTHPALCQILVSISREEKRAQAETMNYTLDGQKLAIHVDWRIAPGHEESLDRCFVAVKDITALKDAQAALQRTNIELTEYANALEQSNEELEHFAYVASHDLREPLRTVTGFLQLLERYAHDQLDERAASYIENALAGVARMSKMIKALLDLSRIESRGQAFEIVDLDAVLAQTLEALQQVIEETAAEITHDPLPTLMGDPTQLSQLFQNLVANALKFRRKDEPPRVHVSAEQEEGNWCFAVHDNGIGIDPQQHERVFQIFQRLHTQQEYPGVGIGLALCKRIVERHGGRMWVEARPGAGSTFYFTLTQ